MKVMSSNNTKLVLLWSPLFSGLDFLQTGKRAFDHPSCKEKRCEITTARNRLMESDAVLFHLRTLSMTDIPNSRDARQKWIFFSLEAPPYSQFHGLAFMRNMFNWTMTYRKDSDIAIPYGKAVRTNASSFDTNNVYSLWRSKSKMAVWMVSHCDTDSRREDYVKELTKHMDVATYSECGVAVCPLNKTNECLKKFSKQFFFYLAFENAICDDYVTEKFYRTLNHGMIPVVFGGGDYASIAPTDSYIDAMKFSSPKELADYLYKVASNFSLFSKYYKWKTEGYEIKDLPNPCVLCEKLHSKSFLLHSVYDDMQKWWIKQSYCRKWPSS
ncbi:alpha-(1,3)-fucosyltransferase C-like [Argiope bruennichi]|uniref:alpha-(1,3)-fucosyltransferase C-like n=1 Tax=Argiope bruennichi TaxID=94029 RepID=UPI0024956C35|nr:alpha-(1,3)-fucosyltransferase C-like [Argiope bruennichi]XP_055933250.1 alpha-(1,3)-fucosyltransferase C-like [Argiope bruennichi]XP_055933252.1 alpha-(1,3)-fucosyltransferase C-like [Argiope bruennichi]XP_055933253.1 alpha-(1,3)-fucosyltransferase C-like [Argiope bruennichi]XP_055933254.1 alpha-(1,3)-fucosyltransferase C-like [Argiope bruennichi]